MQGKNTGQCVYLAYADLHQSLISDAEQKSMSVRIFIVYADLPQSLISGAG
jgi:hypothetical protein